MLRILPTLLVACILFFQSFSQQPPKRELRGAWITTYLGLDWPKSQSVSVQKSSLIAMLDQHKQTGINVIYFQVRSQCDAMYPSAIEPWSAILTGKQGKDPGYDPMQFAIEECHKRGMEFHAWINPYRAVGNEANLAGFDASHIAKQKPDWTMRTTVIVNNVPIHTLTLNPGIPGVRDHINAIISDIVTRYDIDGIHFDDYFYPNPGMIDALDNAAFAADPRGFTLRTDWRRDNINKLIQRVQTSIAGIKPWVEFGVSPTGIYRSSTDPLIGSPTLSGALQHYSTLYADSRKWLQEGWVDYIAPQVYWYIGQPGSDYALLVPWWNKNAFNRHIYIGMAAYKVNDPVQGTNWANRSQIPNQVRLNRKPEHSNIYGEIFFRTQFMQENRLGFRDSLRMFFYNKPALLPKMPWRDDIAPQPATDLKAVKYANDSVVLKWSKPPATENEFDKAKRFVIYRNQQPTIDLLDANSILAITNMDEDRFVDKTIEADITYYYTVTAIDRFHNESISSNATDNIPPDIVCPVNQQLFLNEVCTVTVPDYRSLVQIQDDILPDPLPQLTQMPAPGTIINGKGNFTVTVTATDQGGNNANCNFNVSVLDTTRPWITNISVDPASLWPPNHKMRNVKVSYDAGDNCETVTTSLTVSSNEPLDSLGDGDTETDWEVLNDHLVKLRAERSGIGSGRIYTITITATDASGNTSTATVDVNVPHDRSEEIITQRSKVSDAKTDSRNFKVDVLSNPARSQFTLITSSPNSGYINMRVTDNLNRVVERKSGIPANGTVHFGSGYRPGIYNVEIIQGSKRVTMKLVKVGR